MYPTALTVQNEYPTVPHNKTSYITGACCNGIRIRFFPTDTHALWNIWKHFAHSTGRYTDAISFLWIKSRGKNGRRQRVVIDS